MIPDPIELMNDRIDRWADKFKEGVCQLCGSKVKYELICMSPTGDGPAVCGECAEASQSNCSNKATNLTPETLNEAIRLFETIQPVAGIACHPSVANKIKAEQESSSKSGSFNLMFQTIPILIDPRLDPKMGEVHRDQSLWLKRCKEQREWDEKQTNH